MVHGAAHVNVHVHGRFGVVSSRSTASLFPSARPWQTIRPRSSSCPIAPCRESVVATIAALRELGSSQLEDSQSHSGSAVREDRMACAGHKIGTFCAAAGAKIHSSVGAFGARAFARNVHHGARAHAST